MYLQKVGLVHLLAVGDDWHMYRCIPRCRPRIAGDCPSSPSNTYQGKYHDLIPIYTWYVPPKRWAVHQLAVNDD